MASPKKITCEPFSDEELVSLVLREPDHYLCLMRRYEAALLRYVMRISGFRLEDAEEVVQEAFLKAYLNLRGFDVTMRFSAWLYRIARNETVSAYRRRNARPLVVLSDDEADSALLEQASADFGFGERMAGHFDAAAVREALGRLDEKYREVLVLRYLEEKDYQEIADILRKPPGTVATLISRAKVRLREEMEGLGFGKGEKSPQNTNL